MVGPDQLRGVGTGYLVVSLRVQEVHEDSLLKDVVTSPTGVGRRVESGQEVGKGDHRDDRGRRTSQTPR